MTDAANPPPVAPVVPPAPQVDVAAIAQQAAAAATAEAAKMFDSRAADIAKQTRADIARSISGEQPVSQERQVLENFAKDPVKTLRIAADVAKKEMREELEQERQLTNTQRAVLNPLVNEYPELNSETKLDYVQMRANRYQSAGDSYAVALEKGAKDAVKEFSLKSVSEAQRESGYRAAGLPGGGGFSQGAPTFDPNKSQQDFFSGMKERMNAQRKRA